MKSIIELIAKESPLPYLSEKDLILYLNRSDDSRYGIIKRALANGELIRIKRGVYCFGNEIQDLSKINLFALAQRIYSPSYISFESALAYHQWIPEAVYITTSASTKRYQEFKTPVGIFQFYRLPYFNFFCGVISQKDENQSFLIATPIKAICDYIYTFKKNWQGIEPLVKSLRIEEELLKTIDLNEIEPLEDYYKSQRIKNFLTSLKRDLGL